MEIRLENTKYLGLALGIASLTLMAFFVPQEKAMEISEITPENSGLKGTFYGTIKELRISGNNAFFLIKNRGKAEAVYFTPSTEQMSLLKEGAVIEALAKISVYRGKSQIIIEKVKRID